MNKQINCPACGRKLFEKEEEASGYIVSKCSICRNILRINLETGGVAKIKKMFRPA